MTIDELIEKARSFRRMRTEDGRPLISIRATPDGSVLVDWPDNNVTVLAGDLEVSEIVSEDLEGGFDD